MALVTVQRSPSPSGSPETEEQDSVDAGQDSNVKSPRQRSFSESYFTVKGAAFILPQSDYERTYAKKDSKSQGDIQTHLQAMFSLLRPNDTIKVAVKLEGAHTRYLAVVSCIGRQDTEESVILGINLEEKIEIGLIVPIWAHTNIELDGDGGFSIKADHNVHIFKPVSVQAMWSALQSLNKVVKIATDNLYIPRGLTHTWVGFYEAKLSKDTVVISEWNVLADVDSSYRLKANKFDKDTDGEEEFYRMLKTELKLVMMTVDLEEVTCRYVREVLEKKLEMDLRKYKGILDLQMFEIMGQMDAPTKILDYLYLGSEWNASNLEELQQNGVQYILNISREIDNFFTGILHYMNVREWDIEQSDLLKYWEDTHKFINKARKRGSKTLVHCKMGISRSASTVIAYLMKEFKWSLEEAHNFTKSRRSIVNPNTGFWKQLVTYEGILKASWNRESFERKDGLADKPKDLEELPEETEYRSAEDMLAVNVGKDLPESSDLPILHTEQDIEVGSRSADSTEESLPDQFSPNVSDAGGAVKKKRYPRLDSKAVESGDYLSSDSSDSTDSDSLSSDIEVKDDKVFLPIDIPGVTVNEGQDEKKVAKPKEQRAKSESDKTKLGVEENVQSLSRESSVSKFKPDGSWIKAESPEEENGRADDDPGLEMQIDAQEGAIETFETATSEPMEMSVKSEEKTGIRNISVEPMAEKDEICRNDTDIREKENDNKETEISDVEQKDTILSSDRIPSEDLKALEPYIKENIPWNVGTVRKQREDLEEKYGSIAQRKSDPVREMQISDKNEDDDKPEANDTAEKIAETTVHDGITQTAEKSEVVAQMKDDANAIDKEDEEQISVESPKLERADKDQSSAESPKSKRSVYDLEEIDLPEGIVKKTMMEIEERNRLSVTESPRKRLQRSSSLKSNRVTPKAKDRDNERRKTCIAILSPTYNRPESDQSTSDDSSKACHDPAEKCDLSQQQEFISPASVEVDDNEKKEDDVQNQTGTVKIYKYMGEELTVQEGMVRKQTLDIEHKAKEGIPKQASLNIEKQQTELYFLSIVSSDTSSTQQVSTTSAEETNQTELLLENIIHSTESPELSADIVENLDKESLDKKSGDELPLVTIESIKSTLYDRGKKSDDSASDDQTSKESIPCTPMSSRSKSRSHPESRFDSETLHLIREIGSALMNSPAKCELEESKDDELQEGESRVNFFVRKIEKNINTSKKKTKREIVIIEKERSDDKHKLPCDSTAEQEKHSVQQPICDSNEIKEASMDSPIARGSPVARRNTFPSSIQFDHKLSPKSDSKICSIKWSPTAKKDSAFDKGDHVDLGEDKGGGKSHSLFTTAEITGSIDSMTDCSAQSFLSANLNLGPDITKDAGELTECEGCSVKSLVDIFSAKSTASSATVVSSTTTTTSNSDKLSEQMVKVTGVGKSLPKHDKPYLKHRQSEPVISLSATSLQMGSKAFQGVGLEEKDVLREEIEIQSTEIPQEDKSDRLEPFKIVEKKPDFTNITGATQRKAFRQTQTLSECEASPIFQREGKKFRTKKTYGKSHPLAKLENRNSMDSIRTNPFYNTM